ncbi:GNAT family N-acetyltransferase [Kitasatospora sp. NPDC006697]|uniref:GNAT family N-acetyltransferase n=1 Tax=Kitasatospora sp. NPDC006697 TaxID=3364020 RepID=UPI0036A99736
MGRRIVPLTLDNLADLPGPCHSCVFWELDPVSGRAAVESGKAEAEKEGWISAVLLEWGSCGRIVYVDEQPAGFVLYAPPAYVPRSQSFPTSPVSPDAVQLMISRVLPAFQGQGLGRVLVQTAAKDLLRRNVRAIEAIGVLGTKGKERPSCLLPAEHLLAVGFKTVRPHHRYPRLRLEARTTLSWRRPAALDRLLGGAPQEPALRPF